MSAATSGESLPVGLAVAARRLGLVPLVLAGVVTVSFAAGAALLGGVTPLLVRVYVLSLGAIALWLLVRLVQAAYPSWHTSAFDAALRRTAAPLERPTALVSLERQVGFARWSAGDFHFGLRRVLRGIAADRLAARHGVQLEGDPVAARALLGAEVWALLEPASEPADRYAPGPSLERLSSVVDALERL